MIGDCDPCPDCNLGLAAQIKIHLPENYRNMTEAQAEYESWIQCAHCGKILKYACTRRPATQKLLDAGFRWQT